MLASGDGVHYPMLTFALGEIAAAFPDQAQDIGFFALPGEDAGAKPATVWSPGGIYLPQRRTRRSARRRRSSMAFYASPEGCEAQTEAVAPTGPYPVEGCDLPADVLPAVQDIQKYFDTDGGTGPALEFLSPVKGPALEQITVEVGSGIRSAEDGAALYDQDVEKQAQQLGLAGLVSAPSRRGRRPRRGGPPPPPRQGAIDDHTDPRAGRRPHDAGADRAERRNRSVGRTRTGSTSPPRSSTCALFVVPTFSSFYFSLTRWTLFNQEFIGLDNFVQFFQEPALVRA